MKSAVTSNLMRVGALRSQVCNLYVWCWIHMIVILKEDMRQLDYPLRVGATSELGLTSFTVIKRNRSNFKRNRVTTPQI